MNHKRLTKRWPLGLLVLPVVVFLSACANTRGHINNPITEQSTGFWDHTILYHLSQFIIWLSNLFGGNYAVGIILVTIIIRALLIPLYNYQMKSSEQMQIMQPELKALQAKYASRDTETQMKLREATSAVYKKYNYNMWSSLLPVLLQLPILAALYQAISRTEVLTHSSFLWMQLGEADPYFVLPVLGAIAMWYTSYLTSVSTGQKSGTVLVMQWGMPIIIFLITMGLASAIALYIVTGNVFTILQTLLLNNPYKKQQIRNKEEAKQRDLERRLEKARRNPRKKKR